MMYPPTEKPEPDETEYREWQRQQTAMKTCRLCDKQFEPERGAEHLAICPQCWNVGLAMPPKMTAGEVDEARAEIEREGRAV